MLKTIKGALTPVLNILHPDLAQSILDHVGWATEHYSVSKLVPGETVFSPEVRLRYERGGSVIRFSNTIKGSDEMREVLCGIVMSFGKDMQADIIKELTFYHKGEGEMGTVAKAISGGLKGGAKLS